MDRRNCPYCKIRAKLVDSKVVYGRSYGPIWLCRPCDAWVGCHKDSNEHVPLGRLANKELRLWKVRAHSAFDPLWARKIKRDSCSKSKARKSAYIWLAEKLQIPVKECHIGMFDVEICREVVAICGSAGNI